MVTALSCPPAAMVTVLMIAIAVVNHRNTVVLDENAARVAEAHEILDLTQPTYRETRSS